MAGPQYTPRRRSHVPIYPNSIRHYRLALHLTQGELADQMGCTEGTIGRWERGASFPRATTVFRLAKTLDTLAEALYPEFYMTRGPANLTGHSQLM